MEKNLLKVLKLDPKMHGHVASLILVPSHYSDFAIIQTMSPLRHWGSHQFHWGALFEHQMLRKLWVWTSLPGLSRHHFSAFSADIQSSVIHPQGNAQIRVSWTAADGPRPIFW